MTGSPHSQATPGSPVTSSVSTTTAATTATTAAVATPLTASQHNKGTVTYLCMSVYLQCVYIHYVHVTVHRKTDHFLQKLEFKLLLLVDTSIFAECNGS